MNFRNVFRNSAAAKSANLLEDVRDNPQNFACIDGASTSSEVDEMASALLMVTPSHLALSGKAEWLLG